MSSHFRNEPLGQFSDTASRWWLIEREVAPRVAVPLSLQEDHPTPDEDAVRIACALENFRLRAAW